MTELDRANALEDLNSRHEEVLKELEALDNQIEAALVALRPPATSQPLAA